MGAGTVKSEFIELHQCSHQAEKPRILFNIEHIASVARPDLQPQPHGVRPGCVIRSQNIVFNIEEEYEDVIELLQAGQGAVVLKNPARRRPS